MLQNGNRYENDSLPFSPCDIFITDNTHHVQKINSSLVQTLRKIITGTSLRQYWVKKHKLETVHRKIDWELRKKSLNNIPTSRQQ